MKNAEFDRLAPRYLDGSLSERQVAVVTREMQHSPEARERLETLERESGWLKSAFAARPISEENDLSRVLMRVRRRNPHRKRIVHPALALTAQALFTIGLIITVFSLNADLVPPEMSISDIDGKLSTPSAGEDGSFHLAVGVPLTTPKGSQARISFSGIDDVLLSQNTRLSVKPPADGIREVIELEHGEIWTFLRRREEPLLIRFDHPSLERWQIRADSAQVALRAGKGSELSWPRALSSAEKRPDSEESFGVARLLSGMAWIEDREGELGPYELSRGVAYVMGKEKPIALNDPDAALFSRLTLEKGERFKLEWNWASPEVFPLSVDGATLPVWNLAQQYASEINTARQRAQTREGREENRLFDQRVDNLLAEVVETPMPLTVLEAEGVVFDDESLRLWPEHKADGGNPEALRAVRKDIGIARAKLDGLKPADVAAIHALLQGMEQEARQRENLGYAELKRYHVLAAETRAKEDAALEATEAMQAHRDKAELDGDHAKRKALEKTIAKEEAEAIRLHGINADLEVLREEAYQMRNKVNQAKNTRDGVQEDADAAAEEIARYQAVIDETVFSEELLKAAEERKEAASAAVRANSQRIVELMHDEKHHQRMFDETTKTLEQARIALALEAKELHALESESSMLALRVMKDATDVERLEVELSRLALKLEFAKGDDFVRLVKRHQSLNEELKAAKKKYQTALTLLGSSLELSANSFKHHQAREIGVANAKEDADKFSAKLKEVQAELALKKTREAKELRAALAKAEGEHNTLVENGRTVNRARRLQEDEVTKKAGFDKEITALDAKIAELEAPLGPKEKKVKELAQIVAPLKGHLQAVSDAEQAIKAIERAIDQDLGNALSASHMALAEVVALFEAVKQATIVQSVVGGAEFQSHSAEEAQVEQLKASIKAIDESDNARAALHSDEAKQRSELGSELLGMYQKAFAHYERLSTSLGNTLESLTTEGETNLLAKGCREARARRLAAQWLRIHAGDLRASVEALLDKKIVDYRDWVDLVLGSEKTDAEALPKLLEELDPFMPKGLGHAGLANILKQEEALSSAKPKQGQSRLNFEEDKIEKRSQLLKEVRRLRAESPSAYNANLHAMVRYHSGMVEDREALVRRMWTLFLNPQALLPSEARELSVDARESKLAEIQRDYFHAYLAGDVSGEEINVHGQWKRVVAEKLPRAKLAQLNWMNLQD